MILTYRLKHNASLSKEIATAYEIALYAVSCRKNSDGEWLQSLPTQFNMKPQIVKSIMKKYGKDCKTKNIDRRKMKIVLTGNIIKYDRDEETLRVPGLGIDVELPDYVPYFDRIALAEVDEKYVYLSVMVDESDVRKMKSYIGVDINTAGHVAVCANPKTGKIWKMGKNIPHLYMKYSGICRASYGTRRYQYVEQKLRNKLLYEAHRISKRIVNIAIENHTGIKLEKLSGIRKESLNSLVFDKKTKNFKWSMDSYFIYNMCKFIDYKSKLLGIPVQYVDPDKSSKTCSRCGEIGERKKKHFVCSHCGHQDDSDSNAAFIISLRTPIKDDAQGISQVASRRDICKGKHDIPKVKVQAGNKTKSKKLKGKAQKKFLHKRRK